LRTPGTRRGRRPQTAILCVRLDGHVRLETRVDGSIVARFHGHSVGLGTFGAEAACRAKELHAGLPLASFSSGRRSADKEIATLIRRLARHGLVEYPIRRSLNHEDQIVIEPQVPDYWPRASQLRDSDALALSRFAYMRRRGNDMVLESPRAGALFRICDSKIAAAVAMLSAPHRINKLRLQDAFPGIELLGLMLDCQILFKVDARRDSGLRQTEGSGNLVLWDFHDLLFHARSTEGRHANPLGGVYQYAGVMPPLPAVRPRWPGRKIDLRKVPAAHPSDLSPVARLLRKRHSIRSFDDRRPITLAELARFLDGAARVLSRWNSDAGDAGPAVEYAVRPYPSAGASYELELYLAVHNCDGLARGFYHYDAGGHALIAVGARSHELEALLTGAQLAMGASAAPQILITMAARFGRMSWKYSSIAYALILKNVGVFTQTLYLMATDMGFGGCAIGSVNIDLFAKMTGLDFHIEGPVGQFAIGRSTESNASDRH
jgi:SagB-type dehydrogenase family enzyme